MQNFLKYWSELWCAITPQSVVLYLPLFVSWWLSSYGIHHSCYLLCSEISQETALYCEHTKRGTSSLNLNLDWKRFCGFSTEMVAVKRALHTKHAKKILSSIPSTPFFYSFIFFSLKDFSSAPSSCSTNRLIRHTVCADLHGNSEPYVIYHHSSRQVLKPYKR